MSEQHAADQDSDLARMMHDLRKKGWNAGRLKKLEATWDCTTGFRGRLSQDVRATVEDAPAGGAAADPADGWAPVEWSGTMYRVDPPAPGPDVMINCAERVHLCKAVCCKLNFALTPGEVRSGKVKWDQDFPHLIAHGPDGYCAHLDRSKGCNIFADRPALCRRFDCRTDGRVWKDFDSMIPNSEWIDGIVSNHRRVVLRSLLPVVRSTDEGFAGDTAPPG